ncbi:hypothetical protein DPMN_091836 [Dreissena polymorpha]|uniref:Uncharacterized protein n=1 Tax=Dreissena polymorpha TaxID=45954 RepID=A0A9D4R130_DREPO|nr:hypothetical protein DPMN_091836 [Dreissena polymorpha]
MMERTVDALKQTERLKGRAETATDLTYLALQCRQNRYYRPLLRSRLEESVTVAARLSRMRTPSLVLLTTMT